MREITGLDFRELVDAGPDGIVVCDPDGSIVLVNVQAERMFGYPREELIGKRIETLIPERVRARHPQHVAAYTTSPRTRPMGSAWAMTRRIDGNFACKPFSMRSTALCTSSTDSWAAKRQW